MVERVFTAKTMRLSVTERREGGEAVTFTKPQAMLSALVSGIAFDPEAFSRMAPREQGAMLAELTGLDTADLDAEYAEVFEERKLLNRDIKQRAGDVMPEGARPAGVDVQKITTRLNDARLKAHAKLDEEMTLRETRDGHSYAVKMADEHLGKIEELKRSVEHWVGERDRRAAEITALEKSVEAMGNPNETEAALMTELQEADSRNAAVREYDNRHARTMARERLVKQSESLTHGLEITKSKRAARIAETTMPVEGLSIEDGVVLFEGVPFSQASKGRSFDISLAIGMAANPKLRVLRIEHGSLLDSKMMASVEKRCIEKGWQAFVERVADTDSGVGIYIEDGVIAKREEKS